MNKEKFIKGFVLSTMVGLYIIVSLISTLHVVEFFKMSNPDWLAISLAIAFEIGAAASLASIIVLEKTSKTLVWGLFILLTTMQIQGNMFYAYTNLENFQDWIDLFGLHEEELIIQKRILSIVSGAILPIVALGFIKSLVDYIRPSQPAQPTEVMNKYTEQNKFIETETVQTEQNQFIETEQTEQTEQPTITDEEVKSKSEIIQKPKVSPNHEFYTNRGLIKAKDLLESDEIQKPQTQDEFVNEFTNKQVTPKTTVSQSKTVEDSFPVIDGKTGNVIIEPKVSTPIKNYVAKP
jgi:hypothetical protein